MPTLHRPRAAVLLGAQRFQPTLGSVVEALGIRGKIAIITAGWQEREPEDEELSAHLGGRTVNLTLHARGDQVFREDPDLFVAHRERQDLLRHVQDFYRIRLEKALEAERTVRAHVAPERVRDEVEEAAIEAIRDLDTWHLDHCARIRQEFDDKWDVQRRPSVAKQREEIGRLMEGCTALAIAGGHVALLINRMLLFDIGDLVGDRAVFAWQAGAMAVSDRIVLFHDDPPQGPEAREVLDYGLGLVPGVVVLPSPETRLRLDDQERVRLLARRFAPSRCLAFPARSHLVWQGGEFTDAKGVIALDSDGAHRTVAAAEVAS